MEPLCSRFAVLHLVQFSPTVEPIYCQYPPS